MSEYKNMVKGTANAIGTKAKNYVESGKMRDAYLKGMTTAKCYANIAKLNLQINGQLEEQKDIFAEIGRLFYDENRDCVNVKYAALFDELEESDKKIDAMRSELEAIKAAVAAAKENKGK